jgi:hypothetical protein
MAATASEQQMTEFCGESLAIQIKFDINPDADIHMLVNDTQIRDDVDYLTHI